MPTNYAKDILGNLSRGIPVLSLSAGCQRNLLAEKTAFAGWIFSQRSLSKAQQVLPPTAQGALHLL